MLKGLFNLIKAGWRKLKNFVCKVLGIRTKYTREQIVELDLISYNRIKLEIEEMEFEGELDKLRDSIELYKEYFTIEKNRILKDIEDPELEELIFKETLQFLKATEKYLFNNEKRKISLPKIKLEDTNNETSSSYCEEIETESQVAGKEIVEVKVE